MMDREIVYARKGEPIICEAGHVVTRPTRDLINMQVVHGDMLEGMGHLRSADPASGIEGDAFPPCPCGERWYCNGALRFEAGYRIVEDGRLIHVPLKQISAGWADRTAERAAREFWA